MTRTPDQVVDDNLFVVQDNLRPIAARSPTLAAWLAHLQAHPDDYERWLGQLAHLAGRVHPPDVAARAQEATALIQDRAYGAASAFHVAWSWRLREGR